MDILQLKYFTHAAETQNFSHTAQFYRVPASNISQMIKRLENELETKLFYRSANTVVLSEKGEQFYEYAQKALALLEEGKRAVKDSGELTGEIKLLILTNRRIATGLIQKFKAKHPGVNFVIKHTQSGRDDYDILISDVCDDNKMCNKLLVEEKMAIAMNKNNPLCKKKRFDIADYKNERFITMQQTQSLTRYTRQICNSGGFDPNVAIENDDPFYVRKYVEIGLGVAVVPMTSWKGLFSDDIECRVIDGIVRRTYLWWHGDRQLKKCVQMFIESV